LPYKSANPFFNQQLADNSSPYEFGETFTYNKKYECNFTNRPLIVGRLDINVGMAQKD